jgi:hypothetical protein
MIASFSYGQTKKYIPVQGKVIGIWPHNNRFTSVEKLAELKNRWGFEHLLVAAIYGKKEIELAYKAGFESTNIMLQIYLPDYSANKEKVLNVIRESGKIGAYYFDEPISRKHSIIDFLKLIKILADEGFYPHGKFVVSEINEYRAKSIEFLVDDILYSGYGGVENQAFGRKKSWTEWKQVLSSKMKMVWISSLEDSSDYKSLFKAAKELGMHGVWFYQLEPLHSDKECDDSNFEKFCEAAVEFGFLEVGQ